MVATESKLSEATVTSHSDIVRLSGVKFAWSNRGPATLDIDSLRVAQGERVFLLGPSGSGKTTLLSLLGGVITPQQGEVNILDQRLDQMRGAQRDRFRADHIGFIFQMFNLIPYLSLVDNVLLPCHFSALRKQRAYGSEDGANIEDGAKRLLGQLGLDASLFHRKPTALSVGQQQRVAAARALIGQPSIVIADEPTSALDADARQRFIELLFDHCAQAHTTLIFVSHDTSLARYFDREIKITDVNAANGMQ